MDMNRETKQYAFGPGDVGCHVDGAFGDDHLVETLASMVEEFAPQLAKDMQEDDAGGAS